MTEVSPLIIKLMLAIYVTPEPEQYFGDGWESGAAGEGRAWLLGHKLIDSEGATERGEAWVKFICSTPLPEQSWVLPERNSK